MGMIKENAPSGAKEIRKTKRKENPGTSLGPGLVGGAKNSAAAESCEFSQANGE
jgi:hypothetical protein